MKKTIGKLLLFILVPGLFFSLSCRHEVKVIPEITGQLSEIKVYDFKDKEPVRRIIKKENKLFFVSLKGEVFRFDPANQILDFMTNLNMRIEPAIYAGHRFILLKEQGTGNYVVFDLEEMRTVRQFELPTAIPAFTIDHVLDIEEKLLVYRQKGKLVFYDTAAGAVLTTIEPPKNDQIYECETTGSSTLVLTGSTLYTFAIQDGKAGISSKKLKAPAASGFLIDGDYIYYGSKQRQLVKLNYKSAKIDWRFKLPQQLVLRPQAAGRYIVITPEDNNIYFFKRSGSLHWWANFDAPRALPPVMMKDNAAVFLMNRIYRDMNNKIKFFNYKKKLVTAYELQYRIESAPVYLDDYLYVLCSTDLDLESKPAHYLLKIGNRYDADIDISPQWIKPVKKSVIFNIKPVNLVKPRVTADLYDQENNKLFNKEIGKPGSYFFEFVWMPEKPGMYRLLVTLEAENRQGIEVERTFRVEDIDQVLKSYYYQIQRGCPGEFPQPKAKAPGTVNTRPSGKNKLINKDTDKSGDNDAADDVDEDDTGKLKKQDTGKGTTVSGQKKVTTPAADSAQKSKAKSKKNRAARKPKTKKGKS